jgi:hypothetical protein
MKTTQFKLILPADVKAWLEAEAKKNLRSQSAQIVTCLRTEMTKGAESQGAYSRHTGFHPEHTRPHFLPQ